MRPAVNYDPIFYLIKFYLHYVHIVEKAFNKNNPQTVSENSLSLNVIRVPKITLEVKSKDIVDEKASDKLYTGFLLATAYASTIGGIGSMGNNYK